METAIVVMTFLELVRARRTVPVARYLFYVTTLSAGYYYNLTFVQLGLIDLGTRRLEMGSGDVSVVMGGLDLLTLVVADGVANGGELLHVAGRETPADGAEIEDRTIVEVTPADPDPVASFAPLVLTTLVLALSGALFARRNHRLLENVGTTARNHALVSLTVGALLFLTFLTVFVFMAFTLVLIPVSLLGLLVGLASIVYGVLGMGYLVGRRLGPSRVDVSTGLGVVVVVGILQVGFLLPVVGDFLVGGVLLTGLGAVVVTYYELRPFEPVSLPE